MTKYTAAAVMLAFLIAVAALIGTVFLPLQPLYAIALLVVCACAHGALVLRADASKGATEATNRTLKDLSDRINKLETRNSISSLGGR